MEKFAVDLDKVLDEFEFNEDCAEQIASVNTASNNAPASSSKCMLETSKNYNYLVIEPGKVNKEFALTPSLDKHKDHQEGNADTRHPVYSNPNYIKNETTEESNDSVNHFYMQDYIADSKLTNKQVVPVYDCDSVSLTIHNDISQKFLQKQQNGSNSPKIDNRYDKKLNQPSSKPSVSNVFNSLNEYINAPTGGLDYVLDEEGLESTNIQVEGISVQNLCVNQVLVKNSTDDVRIESCEVSEPVAGNSKHEYNSVDLITVPSSEKVVERQTELLDSTVSSESKLEDASSDFDTVSAGLKVCLLSDSVNVEQENTQDECEANQTSDNPTEKATRSEDVVPGSIIEDRPPPETSTTITDSRVVESVITTQSDESNKGNKEVVNGSITRKVFEFGNTDDLSEEELTKYLAELEEEDRLNSSIVISEEVREESLAKHQDTSREEEIDEPQIHRNGTMPEEVQLSCDELTEKANMLPMIDCIANEKIGATSNISEILLEDFKEPVDLKEEIPRIEEDCQEPIKSSTLILNEASSITQETHAARDEDILDKENDNTTQEQFSYSMNVEEELVPEFKNTVQLEEKVIPESVVCNAPSEAKSQTSSEVPMENISSEGLENTKESSVEDSSSENSEAMEKPIRPQTLDIILPDSTSGPQELVSSTGVYVSSATESSSVTPSGQVQSDAEGAKDDCQGSSPDALDNSLEPSAILGKQPPFWIPDSDASSCMLCEVKFTMIKRRHHCRACGKVLCSKCCNMKYKLEYQGNIDSRVCVLCYQLLTKVDSDPGSGEWPSGYPKYMNNNEINSPQGRQPNPNNPMEYCSTIPPLQQLAGGLPPPPTVMVPVGVLKREGGTKHRPEGSKSVMFSDGIRPGCDLTELDMSWDLKPTYRKSHMKKVTTATSSTASPAAKRPNLPRIDPTTECYVPQDPKALPPTVTIHKGQVSYHAVTDEVLLYRTLKNDYQPPVMFAINRNLYAYVKVTNLNCCVNKICWNVTSRGLAYVGQDEVILLVETIPDETRIPKDLLIFINQLYVEAIKGNTVSELGFAVYQGGNLLGSREHAGFLFIRQTLQCLQKIVLPPAPFLVGLLVHRWETPWAKVFPLRLLLRLGAEYRYYPCPLVSVRFRDALYFEIGHTVMKVLADFRNYSYTLPGVRGLTIHLRNRTTDVMFPRNRYDQVIKGLNNSNDHVLAYASNFSIAADSHLVSIQTNTGDESNYQTQAINIHNKPRTVTGASFIVINGALKSSMGLSAKSSIVEDGLMVEIMPEKMEALKAALKNMQDFSIGCGRQGAPEPDETVNIKWVDNDVQFNIGVKSPIDGQLMDGVPSIRVHNGTDYKGTSRFIRWTEVFIIKSDDHPNGVHDPVDINKLSGNIAKATCTALVKLLDLLATAGLTKLAVRTTIQADNVGYEAGSEGTKLPPIYMNSLDNELIQVLHKAAQSSQETHTILELIFYVLDD